MSEKIIENNQVTITGMINSKFTFSHELFGEKIFLMELLVERNSGTSDQINIMVSERLMDVKEDYTGEYITIHGQFRSFNRQGAGHPRLLLYIWARSYEFAETEEDARPCNVIQLEGYLCKKPVYRKTPLGREITDIFLAVNRAYGKSDYIPCICWGRNARFASGLEIGNHIRIHGRIQSRTYKKWLDNGEIEQRIAYEVSISTIELLPNRVGEEGHDDKI